MSISYRLGRHFVAASAVAVTFAASAHASVAYWNCNVSIPATTTGLYLNVQTQATGSAGSGVLGWDLDVYTTVLSAPSLTMYGAIGTQFMRAPGQFGYSVGNLNPEQQVGSAGPWNPPSEAYSAVFNTPTQSGVGNWNYNSINYFGFKFVVDTGYTHYGYGRMDVGANANIRTLKFIAWDTTPATPVNVVPAPGVLAVLGMAGIGRSRRRS